MKKIITTGIVISSFAVVSFTFAADVVITPKPTVAENIACVGKAIANREVQLDKAMSVKTEEINAAYANRAKSLEEAYTGITTTPELKIARIKTWGAFNDAIKASKAEYKKSRINIWAEAKTAVKACKPKSGISDNGYSGYDSNN